MSKCSVVGRMMAFHIGYSGDVNICICIIASANASYNI